MTEAAKAHLQKYWDEDPIARKFKRGHVGWGNYLTHGVHGSPPPLPPSAPSDSRMVWNPQLQEYVVGLKRFNYVPDLAVWINRQRAMRDQARQGSTRRRGVTRYYNQATGTYIPLSRSPSRSRSHSSRSHSRSRSRSSRSRSRGRSRSYSTRRKHTR